MRTVRLIVVDQFHPTKAGARRANAIGYQTAAAAAVAVVVEVAVVGAVVLLGGTFPRQSSVEQTDRWWSSASFPSPLVGEFHPGSLLQAWQ